MNARTLGALLICALLLLFPVVGKVDTSSWGGKSKPEMDLGFLGEMATHGDLGAIVAVADMGSDMGLDTNAMFRPADEWNKMATISQQRLQTLTKDPQSSSWEIENAAAMAVRQRELAISKLTASNDAKGSNDAAIAKANVALADTYNQMGPDYQALRYQALEAANEADPLNRNVYNQRIQILNDRNLQTEAEEVRGEMDQAYGEAALNFALPMSPWVVIAGLLTMLFLSVRHRRNVQS
jgi:hypothetical protein